MQDKHCVILLCFQKKLFVISLFCCKYISGIYLNMLGSQWQKQPPEVFCKKSVLRNFVKFTEKQLCQSLFFNKVAGLRPQSVTLFKKRTMTMVLSWCLRTTFLQNISRRLPLQIKIKRMTSRILPKLKFNVYLQLSLEQFC